MFIYDYLLAVTLIFVSQIVIIHKYIWSSIFHKRCLVSNNNKNNIISDNI